MIITIPEFAETTKLIIPGLETIHGTLTAMTNRKYVTRATLESWLDYVTKEHERFGAFKTARGEWFEANHPEASAALDDDIASLLVIKDGLQAKVDALEAEEETVGAEPTWETPGRTRVDDDGNDVYECAKATPAEILARVPTEADTFTASVTDVIRSELEDVAAPGGAWRTS